jgi:catechol 2,3-dioxygenase-like lactoylglutathione lyase family enzyme
MLRVLQASGEGAGRLRRRERYTQYVQLDLMALVVADYDEALEFFVDVLGFEVHEDTPSLTNDGRPKRWVVVRPPEGGTGLLLAKADGPTQEQVIGEQFAGRVGLFLRVGDFDAQLDKMREAGVRFVTEPRDAPFGKYAVFLDVSGNRWDLLGPRAQDLSAGSTVIGGL